ncbi:hypothetical protein QE152_g31498 [Popillia japonica]|uniref:Uncharacterized protein n=1 Tax=Popillia japonica TaxID=7064 RepID=A0AAW1J1F1_POPJA
MNNSNPIELQILGDLTLDELLRELRDGAELSQSTWPDSGIEITIFPPTNDILTAEDSGEEDCGDINNLPGAQLNASAKLNSCSLF